MTFPIPILLYHRIDHADDTLSTPPETFEQQLGWLAENGYRSLTLDEFDHALQDRSAGVGNKRFLLTFDDGYADLPGTVAPALKRHGFTGVAFLITDEMRGNHITWDQARTMANEGVIEFQSHSHTHSHWGPGEDGTRALVGDLARSIDLLVSELRLPRAVFRHLAWPWGLCSPEWERAADDLGLRFQHIVQRGAVTRPNQITRLPRICFDGVATDNFRRWMGLVSGGFTSRLCNLAFGTIRARRHGVGYT